MQNFIFILDSVKKYSMDQDPDSGVFCMDPDQDFWLDPDPDPDSKNTDQKHCPLLELENVLFQMSPSQQMNIFE